MAEAVVQRLKQLEYYRDWLHSNPSKVDPDVRPAAIDFLNNSIAELKATGLKQKKNIRSGKRMPLRALLVKLLVAILTQK